MRNGRTHLKDLDDPIEELRIEPKKERKRERGRDEVDELERPSLAPTLRNESSINHRDVGNDTK